MTIEKRTPKKEPRERQSTLYHSEVSPVKITKARILSDPPRTEYSLYLNNTKIGHAVLKPYEDTSDVFLKVISLKPPYRGHGYGDLLLTKVIADCDKHRQSIWLDAHPLVEPVTSQQFASLVHFYERFGFQQVGKPEEFEVTMVRKWKVR